VLKNRSGKSGTVFHNIRFDNGTSTISCDEVSEFDNSEKKWSEEAERLKEQNYRNGVNELYQRAYDAVHKPKEEVYVDKTTGEVLKGQTVADDGERNVINFG
jgi:hypothetical protein